MSVEPGPPLAALVEAVLLVVDEPVSAEVLAAAVERPVADVRPVLADLAAGYDARGCGFALREVGGGWRYYTRPECSAAVERFVLDGQQARLSTAALETLAVVAYRQPVSRGRVAAVRGVNVDGVMRTLVTRGLVAQAGVDRDSGATLFATTPSFLQRLGLRSLEDLPDLAPLLPDLAELPDLAGQDSRRG